jgi:hypothetical protein
MGAHRIPTSAEIDSLFANSDPDIVWGKTVFIVRRINPDFDFRMINAIFNDVVSLFHGEYPGYGAIKTLYHDLPHTMDVLLCAVRLMHGIYLSGTSLGDDEITMVLIATLMHDIGYAQPQGEETGTGAQYTRTHVKRGVEFMQRYLAERNIQTGFAVPLEPMIHSTDPALKFSDIVFPDERTRLLGQIVVTADLVGQMADRAYLEKLLFLYLEFKEAHFGDFQSTFDMLRKTRQFYEIIQAKLDGPYGGLYANLAFHFKDMQGIGKNYYLDSIEKNIAYLKKVIALDEEEYLSLLKRGGIVEKAQHIPVPQ